MIFEWDENKRQKNIRKHGVDFTEAVDVFFDDMAIVREDSDREDERAFIVIGVDGKGRLLVVAYTYRYNYTIRIFSARRAEKAERKQYED